MYQIKELNINLLTHNNMKAICKSYVYVDDSYFRFNRDCAPRGYGSWAFGFGTKEPSVADTFWAVGTYSEAKKKAIAASAAAGISVVYVLP